VDLWVKFARFGRVEEVYIPKKKIYEEKEVWVC
jgi:hypothetical protein